MPRKATGQVIPPKEGRAWAIRFPAYGKRRYVTLGTTDEGWNQERAEAELRHTLADVERGIWKPSEPVVVEAPAETPTFHEFASEWLYAKSPELRETSAADYEWALRVHLLPFFKDFRLDEITVELVDRYKRQKAREGTLSAGTINKTLTRLAQVLEDAVEYGHLDRNPARGRRRRLRASRPRPIYVDTAAQITALLEAAEVVDEAKLSRTSGRRALIAVLVFAGLRSSEACRLKWRDVDLGSGRITVRRAKTDAGVRQVDIVPALRDELARYRPADPDPEALVFTTSRGTARNKDNVARRVMGPVVEKADEILIKRDEPPLPEKLTAHKLRHTFASLLAACGEEPAYIMDQIGHSDPRFTLRVYTHLMSRRDGERDRLQALVEGVDWAATGSETDIDALAAQLAGEGAGPDTASSSGGEDMGVTGLEPVTSSLSSWRSPN